MTQRWWPGGEENWDPSVQTHAAWIKARVLAAQRYRRSKLRRIDYYVSEDAARIIDALRRPTAGGDASSILDLIVCEWAASSGI